MLASRMNMPPSDLQKIKAELRIHQNARVAKHHAQYFKTGPGEYGHGDVFLGLRVPQTRSVARKFSNATLPDLKKLIQSPIHEERLLALFILRDQYERAAKLGDSPTQESRFRFLVTHKKHINNWDLVDSSVPYILSHYLFEHPETRKLLKTLSKSPALWDRRIAIMGTSYFIRQREFSPTLMLAATLMNDKEDLIHKAVGWMLREVGNRDRKQLEVFLDQWAAQMPRTMLRYAIEKFSAAARKRYLKIKLR